MSREIGVARWQETICFVNSRSPWENFPGGPSGKESTCQCRRHQRFGLDSGLGGALGVGNGNLWVSTHTWADKEKQGSHTDKKLCILSVNGLRSRERKVRKNRNLLHSNITC